MMRSKPRSMKFIKFGIFAFIFSFGTSLLAQEIIPEPKTQPKFKALEKNGKRKVDGIIATVGDYIILDSDIDLEYIELKNQQVALEDITRCQLLGKLMEEKLYAHQARLDTTIVVTDAEINNMMQERLDYMVQQIGSMEKVIKYYNRKDEDDFKSFFFDILKTNKLTAEMQNKVVDAVEITPEEVRTFFKKLEKEELPQFGAEVEVAQIIIEPKVTPEDKQKAIDRLNEIRNDVLNNGASFTTRAVLYSQDPGSRSQGGYYKMNRKTPFVKEFKDVAFGLAEGEISKPFETEFGFHIILVEKIRGQEIELRHILIVPTVTEKAIREAKEKADDIRKKLQNKEMTFAEAARAFSDEKETRTNGGTLLNPKTQDTKFELTKMDPQLYAIVSDLKEGDLSRVIPDEDKRGNKRFKIMTVTKRIDPHTADYAIDYVKIRDLALKEKQIETIGKWTEEKIKETYIRVNPQYRNCEFTNNWIKL